MTKGYKATYNYECLDQLYKVGREYKLDEKPKMCVQGFHYCKDAKDTLDYYYPYQSFKLLEIEDLNPTDTVTRNNKSCSNYIKIIREITDPKELMKLLDNKVYVYKNRIIYYESSYDGTKLYNDGIICFLFAVLFEFISLFKRKKLND